MQYSEFPRSGEKLSRLGFGAMGLAGIFGQHDDEYFIRAIHLALEQGVNVIDTARGYGRSEEIIGKALKQWKGQRPWIATKVPGQFHPETTNPGGDWHRPDDVKIAYPPGSIRTNVEESLRQLDIETIDLIQMHKYWPGYDQHDYWMEELIRLKEEGKVRFIGISAVDHRHDLTIPLIRSGHIDAIQALYNIFDSSAIDAVIPECQAHKVAFLARIVLDEGGLTGFLKADTAFAEGDFRANYFDVLPRQLYIDKVDALKAYIPEHADSLAELAIKFALKAPGVTTALTSMHVHEYAQQNIQAADQPELSDELFHTLCFKHRWIRNFYQARRYL